MALRAAAQALTVNAKTPADTHAALRAVVIALGEKHSYVLPPRRPQGNFGPSGSSAAGQPPAAPMPKGENLDGRIGYISMPHLTTIQGQEAAGERYRETLRDLLISLDPGASCGWVVDLRGNLGGNMWPMLNGLDPLLGDGPFGYFVSPESRFPWVRTGAGITTGTQGDPSAPDPSFTLANAGQPIAVLIGPRTSSSGEMVAIALLSLARSRSFGQPTYNFTTAIRPFALDDGAVLGITTSRVAFADGTIVEGAIQPDELVQDDTKEQASQWLLQTCDAPQVQ